MWQAADCEHKASDWLHVSVRSRGREDKANHWLHVRLGSRGRMPILNTKPTTGYMSGWGRWLTLWRLRKWWWLLVKIGKSLVKRWRHEEDLAKAISRRIWTCDPQQIVSLIPWSSANLELDYFLRCIDIIKNGMTKTFLNKLTMFIIWKYSWVQTWTFEATIEIYNMIITTKFSNITIIESLKIFNCF